MYIILLIKINKLFSQSLYLWVTFGEWLRVLEPSSFILKLIISGLHAGTIAFMTNSLDVPVGLVVFPTQQCS